MDHTDHTARNEAYIRTQQRLAIESNQLDDPATEVEILPIPPPPTTKWGKIYRSAAFQIFIVSILAFSGPGSSEAITALGGGGFAAPYIANAATCASYAAVACVSAIGGPIASRMGIRPMLIIGAATFPINGSAYYVSIVHRVDWYLILGRTLYGIGFAFWYVAEAAMILSYPEEGRRGKYLAVWVGARNLGQLTGGSIALARNVKNRAAGAVSSSTYVIFLVIESIGFPASWFISSPRQVVRSDGFPVILAAKHPWKTEFKILYRAFIARRMLLLIPAGFNSFFYGGTGYTYLARFFSVRARSLSGVVQPAGVIVTTALYGKFILDNQKMNQKRRAQVGFVVFIVPCLACIAWIIGNQVRFLKMATPPKYDWTDKGWANAYMPFWILQCAGIWGQSYVYWLLSCFATDVQSNARSGGIFRFVEACGQAISYGICSNAVTGTGPLYANLVLQVLVIPCTWLVIRTVPDFRADDLKRPQALAAKDIEAGADDEVPTAKDGVNTYELEAR